MDPRPATSDAPKKTLVPVKESSKLYRKCRNRQPSKSPGLPTNLFMSPLGNTNLVYPA